VPLDPDAQSHRSGHRPRHVGQYLPMRHVSAYPRRREDGGEGAGMSAIENISRRHFLGGLFSTGAFVLAARIAPDSAWAQELTFRTRADGAVLHPSVYLGIEAD